MFFIFYLLAATAAGKNYYGIPLHSFARSFHASIQLRSHEGQYQENTKPCYIDLYYKKYKVINTIFVFKQMIKYEFLLSLKDG